jgi:hypothetical protein
MLVCDPSIQEAEVGSRIFREIKKLNPQIIKIPVKKWAHELNGDFSKEETQMASKNVKKCSTSLVIKVMQIKTTLRFSSHSS